MCQNIHEFVQINVTTMRPMPIGIKYEDIMKGEYLTN